MKRLNYIDMAKGFVIISVGVVHYNCPKELITWLMAFIMPLMFILSGITFRVDKYNFTTFLLKKIKTLLVPWIIAVIVNVLFQIFCKRIGLSAAPYTITSIPKRILFAVTASDNMIEKDPIYWFMPCLFVAELVLFLLLRHIKKRTMAPAVLLLFILLSYASQFLIKKPLVWEMDIVPFACVFILIGYYSNNYFLKSFLKATRIKGAIICLSSLIVGTLLIFINERLSGEHIDTVFRQFGILPITIIVACLMSLGMIIICNSFKLSVILYIGKNSLLFYLAQPIVYKIADVILVLCGKYTHINYNYLNGGISLIALHILTHSLIIIYVLVYSNIKRRVKRIINNESRNINIS